MESFGRRALVGTNKAAGTYYYPDANGAQMGGLVALTMQLVCSGGVTMTVEASNWEPADTGTTATWVDITAFATNLATGAAGAAVVDSGAMLQFNGLNVGRYRIKYVTSDATNAIYASIRGM